jgi:hypothetical protein
MKGAYAPLLHGHAASSLSPASAHGSLTHSLTHPPTHPPASARVGNHPLLGGRFGQFKRASNPTLFIDAQMHIKSVKRKMGRAHAAVRLEKAPALLRPLRHPAAGTPQQAGLLRGAFASFLCAAL